MSLSRKLGRSRKHYEGLKPAERLGDAPVEEKHYGQMGAIMQALDEFVNGPKGPNYVKRNGIVVMLFPYEGFDGRCNYMSNGADRKDIVVLMKEMIRRFEGQPELSGQA
jgi:hypothetical protein